jgi:DNA-binding NarL/FixJ family response regulator
MKKLKVNIVDDHPLIVDGLRLMLDGHSQIEVVDVAYSGEIALAQLVHTQPDIVLLDYSLTNDNDPQALNGLQTAERIMQSRSTVKILMLTMHDSPAVIVPCITKGAHGYMLKSERNTDVASAILQLDQLGFYFSPAIAKDLAANIRRHSLQGSSISACEQEVLEALFQGASSKEVADALCISAHTVESHRKNLIHKFNARNSVHLIYLALQQGGVEGAVTYCEPLFTPSSRAWSHTSAVQD